MAKETLHPTRYREASPCALIVPPPATRYQVVRVELRVRSIAVTYPFSERSDAETALAQIRARFPDAHIEEVT